MDQSKDVCSITCINACAPFITQLKLFVYSLNNWPTSVFARFLCWKPKHKPEKSSVHCRSIYFVMAALISGNSSYLSSSHLPHWGWTYTRPSIIGRLLVTWTGRPPSTSCCLDEINNECCFRRASNVPDLSDKTEKLHLTQLFSPVLPSYATLKSWTIQGHTLCSMSRVDKYQQEHY